MLRRCALVLIPSAFAGFAFAESPAFVLPAEQPAANLVGTAFGPQPNPCWSEACEPLYPRGPEAERWSAFAEYLLWQVKPGPLPVPYVTSTTAQNPDIFTDTGRIGDPGTIILGGDSEFKFGTMNGLRFGVGYAVSPSLSVEGVGLYFERRRDIQVFSSDDAGDPVLSIPFFRVNEGRPQGESRFVVAFPDIFRGSIYYDASSQLWGAELNAACNGIAGGSSCNGGWRLDVIGGFRYLGLNENLNLGCSSETLGPGFITTFGFEEVNGAGVVVGTQESFECANRFYGPQIGVRAEQSFGRFFVGGAAKVAIGVTHQTVDVNGYSYLIRQPGAPIETLPGGFFTSPTNIGRYTNNEFSVVPEVGVTFGWQLNECARVSVGYTFLYWSNVARPGEQLDRNLNTGGLPLAEFYGDPLTPARPHMPFNQSGFWAQGVNFNLEVRF